MSTSGLRFILLPAIVFRRNFMAFTRLYVYKKYNIHMSESKFSNMCRDCESEYISSEPYAERSRLVWLVSCER